jgi:hypothetical protein
MTLTDASRWLATAIQDIRTDPERVDELFPVAGRRCGRDTLPDGRRVDDTARMLLLQALPMRGAALLEVLWRLYRTGDTAERRAVLLALPHIDDSGMAVPIVQDALRTNDPRLIEAALGDYATRHLADRDYRQAVLKCVFVGIPLPRVPGLPNRLDAELASMLGRFADERRAADRQVSPDVEEIIEEWL